MLERVFSEYKFIIILFFLNFILEILLINKYYFRNFFNNIYWFKFLFINEKRD